MALACALAITAGCSKEEIFDSRLIGKWELEQRYFDAKLDGTGYDWFPPEEPHFLEFFDDGTFLENSTNYNCDGKFRFPSLDKLVLNSKCRKKYTVSILELSDEVLLFEQTYDGGFGREAYKRAR